MNIVHTLSDFILIKQRGKGDWWGHRGWLRVGIRGKGLGRDNGGGVRGVEKG